MQHRSTSPVGVTPARKTVRRADFPACISPHGSKKRLMVLGYTRHGQDEVMGDCGDYFFGETVTCGPCEEYYQAKYPQGWAHYPGDTCRHGVYVGGIGIDWMCGRCEFGEDE